MSSPLDHLRPMHSKPIPRHSTVSVRLGRRTLALAAPLAAVWLAAFATPASAQEPPPNCPPGSWFCADAEKPAPKAPSGTPAPTVIVTKGGDKAELEPLPPAEALPPPPPPPPTVIYRNGPPPPPVVVYQPPPPVYMRPPPPPPPFYYYRPHPPKPMLGQPNEWGINLRAEGAINGGGSQSSDPMTGVGFALRYKPIPAFGLEAGFDFLGGRDFQNNFRHETEFTVNALVFVNPRSRVQLYFEAGVGGAWANVSTNSGGYANGDYGYPNASYTYFGGQAGGGLEFRIARHFAMNVDVKGFLRTRTDSGASAQPEFTNPQTGQTTNTSDGCLVTAGMTFYF